MTAPGDFVALKFTGAGSQALFDLSNQAGSVPCSREAIDSVCNLAAERGVRLLFDAEQQAVQAGIDAWTLEYMRK
jgi:proline dehydrogenase